MPSRLTLALIALVALAPRPVAAARPDGTLEVKAVDAQTGEPMAVRMVLTRQNGRPLRTRGLGVAQLADHFYVDGAADLELRRGQYRFQLDAGPEFKPVSGHFEIERRASDSKTVEMHRVVDLAKEGWRAADLLVDRKGPDLAAALRGEAVDYCPLTAHRYENGKWQAAGSTDPHAAATLHLGNDASRLRRASGDLLIVRPDGPLTEADLKTIGSGSLAELKAAREAGLCVVAADATSWALPVWLAADVLDGIVVIDQHSSAGFTERGKPAGRPRDTALYPGQRGHARWQEAIYFHVLNAGLRVAPLAGSGTGENDLPLGECRTYAMPQGAFTPRAWWDAAQAGEVFVTNGPLLRPVPPPGRVYRLPADDPTIAPAVNLTTRDRVEYLEVIKNGEVEHSVAIRDLVDARGQLPLVDCRGAGWFLIRAVAAEAEGYQRAMTAPFYFEPEDGGQRISRASCEFFLKWLDEAEGEIEGGEIENARTFWKDRIAGSNNP